jgi:hypothetical protein
MFSKRICVAVCAPAILSLSAATIVFTQPSDYRTFFTFSAPVELPGVALPPGEYLFRVADSAHRNVVQVLSADGKTPYGQFFFRMADRSEPASDPEIWFMESAEGAPPPIRTWWYPGDRVGRELVYPKEQARRLAKDAREPVLTTQSQTTTVEQADTSKLSRVGADGQETAVTDGAKSTTAAPLGKRHHGKMAPASATVPASPTQTGPPSQ